MLRGTRGERLQFKVTFHFNITTIPANEVGEALGEKPMMEPFMKNLEKLIQEFGTFGNEKSFPRELDHDVKLVSTFSERIMEESELMIRRIDHIYNSAKEDLEISFDKKEITPGVFFTICEIRLQNYLNLISQVETKRDLLLADRWGL